MSSTTVNRVSSVIAPNANVSPQTPVEITTGSIAAIPTGVTRPVATVATDPSEVLRPGETARVVVLRPLGLTRSVGRSASNRTDDVRKTQPARLHDFHRPVSARA